MHKLNACTNADEQKYTRVDRLFLKKFCFGTSFVCCKFDACRLFSPGLFKKGRTTLSLVKTKRFKKDRTFLALKDLLRMKRSRLLFLNSIGKSAYKAKPKFSKLY